MIWKKSWTSIGVETAKELYDINFEGLSGSFNTDEEIDDVGGIRMWVENGYDPESVNYKKLLDLEISVAQLRELKDCINDFLGKHK